MTRSPGQSAKAPLTQEAVVAAAIELADESGLDALSMRKIADRLDTGAMSLYRHVANKDVLVALMTDEVASRFPYPDAADTGWTWRDRVRIAAETDWSLYRAHPWVLLAFAVPRYSFGPTGIACLGWLVEGFGELGVSTVEATEMAFTTWHHISGAALPVVGARLMADRQVEADAAGGLAALLAGTPLHPVPAALAELEGSRTEFDHEALLRLGLDALCDGLEARSTSGARR